MKSKRAAVLSKGGTVRAGSTLRSHKAGASHLVTIRARVSDKQFVNVKLDLAKKTATLLDPKRVIISEQTEAQFVSGLIKSTPITPERVRAAEVRASRARAARAGAASAKKHHAKIA